MRVVSTFLSDPLRESREKSQFPKVWNYFLAVLTFVLTPIIFYFKLQPSSLLIVCKIKAFWLSSVFLLSSTLPPIIYCPTRQRSRFQSYSPFLHFSSHFPQRQHLKGTTSPRHVQSQNSIPPVCFYSVFVFQSVSSLKSFVWNIQHECRRLEEWDESVRQPPLCPAKWRVINKKDTVLILSRHQHQPHLCFFHRRYRHRTQCVEDTIWTEGMETLPITHEAAHKSE